MNKAVYSKWATRVFTALDGFATNLLHAEAYQAEQKRHADKKPTRSRLLVPEDDVRHLMTSAQSLEDIWRFFIKRLNTSSNPDLMCFSVLDDSNDYIRIKFLSPQSLEKTFDSPIISMAYRDNHLVQAAIKKDTTFTSRLDTLGEHISPYFEPSQAKNLNIFTVPFIADGRSVAMITLGFSEVDAFSQAKLSYVYTLRDQIAQLVWNLTLKERMSCQTQVDTLTGLLTHSYFQQVLSMELEKTHHQNSALTTMILDINNLQDINHDLGHSAGDEAICHLASTIRRFIRGVDTVARYGGNEIVVLLPETDPTAADQVAQRFLNGLKDNIPDYLQDISANVGYATFPHDTKNRENLLKYTEQALHLAKFKGGKTDTSARVAYRETKQINDKTVLEVFASHVAKKYNNHKIFEELQNVVEQKGNFANAANVSPEHMMLETIGSLAGALDAKDQYTRGHSQAVANYAVALCHALDLEAHEVEQIRLAAFLHDIGKIGIPESILCKAGPLNEKEWEVMKRHPVIGARQILAPVTALKEILPMVEYHHENWDGTGYPEGLKGESIPLGARIVSIVDAFHGLTSDRSYRKALPIDQAANILLDGAHTKWDPHLVNVFIKILNIATPKAEDLESDHEAETTAPSAPQPTTTTEPELSAPANVQTKAS